MKVYVIRHGLTELNKKGVLNAQIDEPLAVEGIQQAKKASLLIPDSVQYVYSSTFLRARQTAEIINSKLKRPITFHLEISEINMGSLAGKSWDYEDPSLDLKRKHRTMQFDYRPLGGESAKSFKKRVITFLKKINAKHKDHEVLIVTHGGIIRLLHLLEQDKPLVKELENAMLLTFDLDKIIKK